jgi:endonuclease YncB( thermonuclease family)
MTWLPVQTPAMARTFLLGVVALTALAWPAEVVAQGVKATVLSIGDGDTIRLRQAGKALTVRLACIDAPETAQGMLGSIAREALHGLVGSAPLELRVQTRDRYGRTVAEVFAGGVNVGLEMVRRGDVFVYRQYLSGCDASTYLAAEAQAERSRAGVWRWGNVERPWDFRKNR